MPSPSRKAVLDAAIAFYQASITEPELIAALIALPIVEQAPAPDEPWYDAIIRVRGPVSDLQRCFGAGLIPGPVFERAVHAMLDAGHHA
jgi:hypothetical protein